MFFFGGPVGGEHQSLYPHLLLPLFLLLLSVSWYIFRAPLVLYSSFNHSFIHISSDHLFIRFSPSVKSSDYSGICNYYAPHYNTMIIWRRKTESRAWWRWSREKSLLQMEILIINQRQEDSTETTSLTLTIQQLLLSVQSSGSGYSPLIPAHILCISSWCSFPLFLLVYHDTVLMIIMIVSMRLLHTLSDQIIIINGGKMIRGNQVLNPIWIISSPDWLLLSSSDYDYDYYYYSDYIRRGERERREEDTIWFFIIDSFRDLHSLLDQNSWRIYECMCLVKRHTKDISHDTLMILKEFRTS